MEQKNYDDWFDREFAGTTKDERDTVAIYGPDAVYGTEDPTPTVPSAAMPSQPSDPSQTFITASEGYQNFMAAKGTTHNGYVALVNRLKALDFAYYQQAAPQVSDEEYEALKYQCLMVEELHPNWLLPDSPTQIVGDDTVAGLPKVGHRTPMLSLQKCGGTTDDQKRESLHRWYDRTADGKALSVEWKYDGNSVALVYQDGQLVEASTRGENGTQGSLITSQVVGLPTIPQHIDAHGRIEVRGELFIPDDRYQALWPYERAKTQQAQVRKVLEQWRRPELAREQGFEFRAFEVIAPSAATPSQPSAGALSHTARMQWAFSQGFTPATITPVSTFDELLHVIASMEDQRDTLGLPTDGIVIKLDDDRDRDFFGDTAHHPKWAIAWKYAAQRVTVTVTKVSATKTGKPCLYFDEQTINGHRFTHVDVKAAAYLSHPFRTGDQIIVTLKPGSSSIQFDTLAPAGTPAAGTPAAPSAPAGTPAPSAPSGFPAGTSAGTSTPGNHPLRPLFHIAACLAGMTVVGLAVWYSGLLIPVALIGIALGAFK